jgi:hypothetical protein
MFGANIGQVIRFLPKSEPERARLIREARATYDSIFSPAGLISEQWDKVLVGHAISGAKCPSQRRGSSVMIKVIAALCSLSSPTNFHEQTVTSSDFADVSMQSCLMGAPQLADWMKQHPAERLAAWRCVIGRQDRKGA